MRLDSRRILGAMAMTMTSLLSLVSACAQIGPRRVTELTADDKPLMAEDVFKNVQLLKGIPVKEFMDTMGFFSASTGVELHRLPFSGRRG